jgi:hypothetical protein
VPQIAKGLFMAGTMVNRAAAVKHSAHPFRKMVCVFPCRACRFLPAPCPPAQAGAVNDRLTVQPALSFPGASSSDQISLRAKSPMRVRHLVAACVLAASCVPAHAEKRLFVVANNPDGYGVDRCLAESAPCGRAIAAAYCRSREFVAAISYRKVDRTDLTGAIPVSSSCGGATCDAFVAIECSR